MGTDKVESIHQELRPLPPSQMNEIRSSSVFFTARRLPGRRGFGRNFLLSDHLYARPAIGPGHLVKSRHLILLLNRPGEFRGMQFKIAISLAIASLEKCETLVEREPSAFMNTKSEKDVVLRGRVRQKRGSRCVGVKDEHKKWRPGRGLAPTCHKHSQAPVESPLYRFLFYNARSNLSIIQGNWGHLFLLQTMGLGELGGILRRRHREAAWLPEDDGGRPGPGRLRCASRLESGSLRPVLST